MTVHLLKSVVVSTHCGILHITFEAFMNFNININMTVILNRLNLGPQIPKTKKVFKRKNQAKKPGA